MMPAGTYWIGDLCYVMDNEWDEFCDLTIKGNECLDGEFNLKDGRRFASYGTMYGDGCYPNNFNGKNLPVDAGLIGCIRVEDLTDGISDLGIVVTFEEPFQTYEKDGLIHFGHVVVDTSGEDEEDDYYDEEDYE